MLSFVKTADGSYSANFKDGEWMHNSQGAFSETVYIYLPVIKETFRSLSKDQASTQICLGSIGLGLGYIELLACGELFANYRSEYTSFQIVSYESDWYLRNSFDFFLKNSSAIIEREINKKVEEITIDFVYFSIVFHVCNYFKISLQEFSVFLQTAISRKIVQLNAAFSGKHDTQTEGENAVFRGICFDAFSAHTSPELWDENLLENLMAHADPICFFGTYASKCSLKRILKSHGFTLHKKSGFQGKRESTFAVRSTQIESFES